MSDIDLIRHAHTQWFVKASFAAKKQSTIYMGGGVVVWGVSIYTWDDDDNDDDDDHDDNDNNDDNDDEHVESSTKKSCRLANMEITNTQMHKSTKTHKHTHDCTRPRRPVLKCPLKEARDTVWYLCQRGEGGCWEERIIDAG